MIITDELIERINEELENHYVQLAMVKKNNIEKHGLTVVPNSGALNMCPTFYAEDFDSEEELIAALKMAENIKAPSFDIEQVLSREYILNNLRACMISIDNVILKDEDALYRPFLDMAIIYRILVPDGIHIGSILLKKSIIEDAGITEEELFEIAKANKDYEMKSMYEVLREYAVVSDIKELPEDCRPNLYILSSKDKTHGATVMISDLIYQFVRELNTDCYLLPASVHEVLLIPYEERIEPEKLLEMVKEVNKEAVSIEDKLTDSVYLLSKYGIKKVA